MSGGVDYVAGRRMEITLRDPDDPSKPLLDEDGKPVTEVRVAGDPIPELINPKRLRTLLQLGWVVPAELFEKTVRPRLQRSRSRYMRDRFPRSRHAEGDGVVQQAESQPDPLKAREEPAPAPPVEVVAEEPKPEPVTEKRQRPKRREVPKDEE